MTPCLALAIVLSAPAQLPQVQVEPFPVDLPAWKKLKRAELEIIEDGKAVTYSGVPLRVVLNDALKGKPEMQALRDLSSAVLIVQATDDYQTAVSAAAVAMDKEGRRYLLAFERDGKALDERQGPVRLIIPGDEQHVRWVRMVSRIFLVRLPKLPQK
jgi:hypothetical protein